MIIDLNRHHKRKDTPFPHVTLNPHPPSLHLNESFANRETETETLMPPRMGTIQLNELIEDVTQVRFLNPDAAVTNINMKLTKSLELKDRLILIT